MALKASDARHALQVGSLDDFLKFEFENRPADPVQQHCALKANDYVVEVPNYIRPR
jgi:hypothetical protein